MSRPLGFNREDALNKIVESFWHSGFDTTSIRDLAEDMGLNIGSLYNTFGNKEQLYTLALDRYFSEFIEPALQNLKQMENPKDAVNAMIFNCITDCKNMNLPAGCFLINSAVSLPHTHPELAKLALEYLTRLEKSIQEIFEKARDMKFLPVSTACAETAAYFMGILVSIRTQAMMGTTPEKIQVFADTALQSIPWIA